MLPQKPETLARLQCRVSFGFPVFTWHSSRAGSSPPLYRTDRRPRHPRRPRRLAHLFPPPSASSQKPKSHCRGLPRLARLRRSALLLCCPCRRRLSLLSSSHSQSRGKRERGEREEMEARSASKELLELEEKKPSFLESNFLVSKTEEAEGETVRGKIKNQKKRSDGSGEEDAKRHTMTALPTSQVLGKVKDFLGVIAEANDKLRLSAQGTSRSEYDIEVLSGNETEYIEMDLLLGVADLQTPEAVTVAEAAIGGSHQCLHLFDESNSSDSEERSEEENELVTVDTGISRKKVPKPDLDDSSSARHSIKRRKITMLD